jgi:hypothetical protein
MDSQDSLNRLVQIERLLGDYVHDEAQQGCIEDGCGCPGSQAAHALFYVRDAIEQLLKYQQRHS